MDAALFRGFVDEFIKISADEGRDRELVDALLKRTPERTKVLQLSPDHPMMQSLPSGLALKEEAYDIFHRMSKRQPGLMEGMERGKRHIAIPEVGAGTLVINGHKIDTHTQLAHEMGHVDDWDDKSTRLRNAWQKPAYMLESVGGIGSFLSGVAGGASGKPLGVAAGLGVPMAMTAATGIPRLFGEAAATKHGLDRLEVVSTLEELAAAKKALDAAGGTYRRGLAQDFATHLALASVGTAVGLGARYA